MQSRRAKIFKRKPKEIRTGLRWNYNMRWQKRERTKNGSERRNKMYRWRYWEIFDVRVRCTKTANVEVFTMKKTVDRENLSLKGYMHFICSACDRPSHCFILPFFHIYLTLSLSLSLSPSNWTMYNVSIFIDLEG